MSVSKRLVFFGNERLATSVTTTAPTLRALIAAGYDIAAVVSHHEATRSRSARQLEIAEVAEAHDIPLFLAKRPSDIMAELAELHADTAVLVAYGRIIPQGIIDLFPRGIINIHPSLLPAYRGPTPVEQTMLDGLNETGVSVMRLSAEMDAGPIFAQTTVPLDGTETKQYLATQLLDSGAALLLDVLPQILSGEVTATPQDASRATYCALLDKTLSQMDTIHKTASQLEREVRAFAGWPKSRLAYRDYMLIVKQARVVSAGDPGFVIPCAEDTYLKIEQLIAPSGKQMSGDAFLRGYAA